MAQLVTPFFPLTRAMTVHPSFDVVAAGGPNSKVNRAVESLRRLIRSVTYEEDVEGASVLELEVINQPRAKYGARDDWQEVVDNKVFAEGNYLDLYMGYRGARQQFMGRIEITKWNPSFPESGPGIIRIKGYDARHRMMFSHKPKPKTPVPVGYRQKRRKHRRMHKFVNMPDEEIVRKIAEKYGFDVDLDTTPVEVIKASRKKKLAGPAEPDVKLEELTPALQSIKLMQAGDRILNDQQVGKKSPALAHFRKNHPGRE